MLDALWFIGSEISRPPAKGRPRRLDAAGLPFAAALSNGGIIVEFYRTRIEISDEMHTTHSTLPPWAGGRASLRG